MAAPGPEMKSKFGLREEAGGLEWVSGNCAVPVNCAPALRGRRTILA